MKTFKIKLIFYNYLNLEPGSRLRITFPLTSPTLPHWCRELPGEQTEPCLPGSTILPVSTPSWIHVYNQPCLQFPPNLGWCLQSTPAASVSAVSASKPRPAAEPRIYTSRGLLEKFLVGTLKGW